MGYADGGCRCEAVRIRAHAKRSGVVYCHCRDCHRSSGAPVSLFAGYRAEQVEWGRGEPKAYESSLGIRRSFCAECGTPLSYEDERLPGEVYLHVGVFDDPVPFEPEVHDWISQKLEWLNIRDDLPVPGEQHTPVTLLPQNRQLTSGTPCRTATLATEEWVSIQLLFSGGLRA